MPAIPSTKEKILDTALNLFYRRGIRSTSVDLIIQESGVHKSTFFKHFPSKTDVVVAFLKKRDDNWMNWLVRRVDELAKKPESKLIALFNALDEWFEQPDFRGCAFINTIAESPDVQSVEFSLCVQHKDRLARYVADLVHATSLKRQGVLVEELLLLIEGAIVRAQMGYAKASSSAKSLAKLAIANHTEDGD
jgi:AcrR family transcriptional regulator